MYATDEDQARMKSWLRRLWGSKPESQPAPAKEMQAPAPPPPAAPPAPPAPPQVVHTRLPNFFIPGAAHSATTSLWQYLRQHPDIYMPPVFELKEPSHFCTRYKFAMTDWQQYLGLFAEAKTQRRVGEASTPYLTSPESPGMIQRVIPDARFIISLRNPADRAYSLYKWMHQYGFETLPTFEAGLGTETKDRLDCDEFHDNNCQYYYNFLYFNSGLYHDQVKGFFDTFGRQQVHVIIFEEFIRQPTEHLRKIFTFLEVDPSFVPAMEVHNQTARSYGPIDPGLRARLLEQYAPNIRQLEGLLGRDLSAIWA
jgi:hypothetical protein